MDKLIDDIIELILGDVDCHHEVDHDEDGIHTSVEYNLNNETKVKGMIRELIQKPGVTTVSEELINKWTRIFHIPYSTGHGIEETKKDIKNMFKEAGVEVVEK